MKGRQLVMDEQGAKTAERIDLQEHVERWEDFYDCLLTRARVGEPLASLAEVREKLRQPGTLHHSGL